MTPSPYYSDPLATLYHGDLREVLPGLGIEADATIADPPFESTPSLAWDVWPQGWVESAHRASRSMWCFGTLRMWLARGHEFGLSGWRVSHDVIWEKHNGSGFARDRFRRVHEQVVHFYHGPWATIHHQVPVTMDNPKARVVHRKTTNSHHLNPFANPGHHVYRSEVGGPRMRTTVIRARGTNKFAIHPTQKSVGILIPLIKYSVPPGGLLLDLFSGAGSSALAAKMLGVRSIAIESDERACEKAALRLAADPLPYEMEALHENRGEQPA